MLAVPPIMDNTEQSTTTNVVQLCAGSCASCNKRSLLHEELCRGCHEQYKDWGPGGWKAEYGPILRKCRSDKKFAFVLYTKLKNEFSRGKFSAAFGPFPTL